MKSLLLKRFYFILNYVCVMVLGIEPKALNMIGKSCTRSYMPRFGSFLTFLSLLLS